MSLRTFLLCLAVGCASCSNTPTAPTPPPASASSSTTSTLAGRVVQNGTTTGIAQAVLTLVDASGNAVTATSDATGAFSFSSLAAGMYSLQTTAPGYVMSAASISVPVTSFTVQLAAERSAPVSTLSVEISGPSTLAIGQSRQLAANVVYTDGTRRDVTNVATWRSTTSPVAAVSSTGLLTAYSTGTTVITAAFQDVSGSFDVSASSQ